ncbi:MAG: hypothetical protein II882_08835 [Lachnospiraceae bacterium]|nr:hypothetical protein [Lachnospiraceae bacterium]
MKKLLVFLLLIGLVLAAAGCSSQPGTTGASDSQASLPDSSEETSTEAPEAWSLSDNAAVNKLIADYFTAKLQADSTAMRDILVPEASVNGAIMVLEAKVYEDFKDIAVYRCDGEAEGESALYVEYQTKFNSIDTLLPGYGWFYTVPDSAGNLKLMTMEELSGDGSAQTAQYQYILNQVNASPLINGRLTAVTAAYETASQSDARLHQLLSQMAAGNYEIPETTEATEEPTESESETEPAQTEEDTTSDAGESSGESKEPLPPVTIKSGVFINTTSVRFRSSPSVEEDNLICYFQTGHFVELLEIENEWAHIIDNQPTNGRGSAQECTGREGYVNKFLITELLYLTVNTDNLRMRSTPSLENNDNIVKEGDYVLYFHTGHVLRILEELDEWYHVVDNEPTDTTGTNQHSSGKEGYIAKQYGTPYKPGE